MSYVALYRKFRPKTFDEVKGQDKTAVILKNQIKSGRIGHAYVFSGTRGTGKTSVAKIFAKAVNCENPVDGSPCGECAACKRIAEGRSLNVIEIDAASSNGVDNIREIIEEVQYSPADDKYKVYIIDEVHMLSGGAFNALLKTLEEPPSYVIFILATTEVHKIPVTIMSRCQRYDFRRISAKTISARLKELMEAEGAKYEEEALDFIARKGDGSMRDALSLLDQCLSFYFDSILTYENVLNILGAVDVDIFNGLFKEIKEGNIAACLDIAEEITSSGIDIGQFTADFTWFLRNILLLRVSEDAEKRIDISADKIVEMKKSAELTEEEELLRYIRIFSKLSADMKYSFQKRTDLEIALIKLCKPEMERNNDSVIARLEKLEKIVEKGNFGVNAGIYDNKSLQAIQKTERAELPAKLKKPVPEEIKKAAVEFKRIISVPEIRQPLSTVLINAEPYYEEETEKLVITVPEEIDKMLIEKEENLALIKEAIGRVTGFDMDFKVKMREEAGKNGDVSVRGLEKVAPNLLTYTE